MLKEILSKYFYPPPVAWKLKREHSHCFVCGTAFTKEAWSAQIDKACEEIKHYIKGVKSGKEKLKD
jgi:hypothetical protein